MDMNLIKQIEQKYLKSKTPDFGVGDTVAVTSVIREGDKQRTQTFKGLVISIKGSGTRKTMTVRKISYGIGVEKIFPVHSSNVTKIEVLRHGKARRAKLYYLRDRVGKLALKVRPGEPVVTVEDEPETEVELEVDAVAEVEEAEEEKTVETVETEETPEKQA
jgi:large subunit ribosomal protein L19